MRLFIACTGAGAGAQDAIWRTPGCSSFFAGAAFPYAVDQINEFIGFEPVRSSSPETALDMAMAAYVRAWNGAECDAVGIGLTATVATLRPHRGDHRIHAAMVSAAGAFAVDVILAKGEGTALRQQDGERATQVVLALIELAKSGSAEPSQGTRLANAEALERLFAHPFYDARGGRLVAPPDAGPLYPGAFDPPHRGHFAIAERAGHSVSFAITMDSPHKSVLSLTDMLSRAKQLRGQRVLFSRGDPLYIDKARRTPGSRFVIGADALQRMLDPKWGPNVSLMLEEFAGLQTTFLVAPRRQEGTTLTLHSVLQATGIRAGLSGSLFQALGDELVDASSSALRH